MENRRLRRLVDEAQPHFEMMRALEEARIPATYIVQYSFAKCGIEPIESKLDLPAKEANKLIKELKRQRAKWIHLIKVIPIWVWVPDSRGRY